MYLYHIIAVTRFSLCGLTALLTAGVIMAASTPHQDKSPSANEARAIPPGKPETRLNLNTASEKALAAVPVIGQDGARAIIAARPFKSINALDRIRGMSAERLEQIRTQVRVSPASLPPAANAHLSSPRTTRDGSPPKVDINTASLETLAALPPVGLKTAQQIIAARPFTRLAELNQIDGLSTERLAHLQLVLTIGSEIEPEQTATPAEPPPVKP